MSLKLEDACLIFFLHNIFQHIKGVQFSQCHSLLMYYRNKILTKRLVEDLFKLLPSSLHETAVLFCTDSHTEEQISMVKHCTSLKNKKKNPEDLFGNGVFLFRGNSPGQTLKACFLNIKLRLTQDKNGLSILVLTDSFI